MSCGGNLILLWNQKCSSDPNAIVQLPEPELVKHQKSISPSPSASPTRQLLEIGLLVPGPLKVDIDHPTPVERATDQVPEPELVSHHISVFPSPSRSPVRHWSLTRRRFVPQTGAGPFQVAVAQPLPVESPTDQLPAGGNVSHQTSVFPSPSRSPVKHCHAKRNALGSG